MLYLVLHTPPPSTASSLTHPPPPPSLVPLRSSVDGTCLRNVLASTTAANTVQTSRVNNAGYVAVPRGSASALIDAVARGPVVSTIFVDNDFAYCELAPHRASAACAATQPLPPVLTSSCAWPAKCSKVPLSLAPAANLFGPPCPTLQTAAASMTAPPAPPAL